MTTRFDAKEEERKRLMNVYRQAVQFFVLVLMIMMEEEEQENEHDINDDDDNVKVL